MSKTIKGRKPKEKKDDHWGIRLSSILKEKKLSNRAVAKILNISPSIIDKWISTGASPADLKLVKALADKLEVDFAWLLTGQATKQHPRPSMTEMFSETPYFDGIARIRIDRLIPRGTGNNTSEE